MIRTIIPCAGFGTRLGMRESQSKEMLYYENKRLIDSALEGTVNPLVISRPKKKDLNAYLEASACAQTFLREGDVSGEWPHTVLSSKEYWEEHNLLVLPDTIWAARSASLLQAQELLEAGSKLVFGVHQVGDPQHWGVIFNDVLREKPAMSPATKAWGFIGFTKDIGERLFEAMADRRPFELPDDVSYVGIEGFKDLTRSWADGNLKRHL